MAGMSACIISRDIAAQHRIPDLAVNKIGRTQDGKINSSSLDAYFKEGDIFLD